MFFYSGEKIFYFGTYSNVPNVYEPSKGGGGQL